MNYKTVDAVILANGEYPLHPLSQRVLSAAQYTACCDGAADEYLWRGNVPDVIVGDADSLSEENRKRFGHLLHTVTEQDTNDLTKAVRYLLSKGRKRIDIVGATGKREDHTMGNISLLINYMHEGADVQMYTNHSLIIPCSNNVSFNDLQTGQQVSIINFGATGLSSIGLVYPVYDFNELWQGTLNRTSGSSFSVKAKGDYLVILNF